MVIDVASSWQRKATPLMACVALIARDMYWNNTLGIKAVSPMHELRERTSISSKKVATLRNGLQILSLHYSLR